MTNRLQSALAPLVSPEALLPEGSLEPWRTAPGREGLPGAVVVPGVEEEVAAVLDRAGQEGWLVLPAGAGGWLQGGGSCRADVVVSTRRLRSLQRYEPADLTFRAGAGLTLSELAAFTRPNEQWLPLDPPGGLEGTLGAAVATGLPGPLRHGYGRPRDHVLGLTMVSGDGNILRWGGQVVKNVAGFDITRLCVGSWGTLGVVTSVSARLFPVPEVDRTLVFRAGGLEDLLPFARAVALSELPLATAELMDPLTWQDPGGVRAKGAESRKPSSSRRAGLVVRILGNPDRVAGAERRLRSMGPPPGDLEVMEGEEGRAYHRGLNDWEGGAKILARLSLLPSRMRTLLEEVENLKLVAAGSPPGMQDEGNETERVTLAADVGAGVIRVAVRTREGDSRSWNRWIPALAEVRARLEGEGGSMILTQGPPPVMEEVGAWGRRREGEEALMVGLKARFDPRGILAPGRLGL